MKTLKKTLLGTASLFVLCHTAGAAAYLWNNPGAGANNWNDNANWLPSTGNPGAGDTAWFAEAGVSSDSLTVNNVVSVNTAVAVLNFTNLTANTWHVSQIPAGVTLTVSNLNIGYSAAVGGNAPSSPNTSVAMLDGGTLLVLGNLSAINGVSATPVGQANLDLSGLASFVFSNSAGNVSMATLNRSVANVKFAAGSNSITAANVNINTGSTSSSATGSATLGAETNIIHAGTLNMGAGRLQCTLSFPAGSTGGLRIRGVAGTDDSLCNMTLGNHNTSGSGSTAAATLALDGHPVDLRLGTLSLGLSGSGPTGNSPGNGTVSFDTGSLFANSIVMAVSSGSSTFALANGTINVGSTAILRVGTGGISMANQSTASGAAAGTLNVTGGTVICSNSITKASTLGTGSITNNMGSLTMVSGVIGTPAVPIDTLALGDSVLNLAVVANSTNIVVNTLSMASTTNNIIKITSLPIITSFPVQFPLIRYGSGSSDFLLGSLPAGYVGSLVNAVGSVDLLISSGPITIRPITWTGTPNGNWDLSTPNWLYLGSPTTYNQADFVTFDDSASGVTGVNLTTSLAPGSLTVSNITKDYTFNGTGSLVGAGLVKDGPGQLTLANSGVNTFSNGVSILGGTLLLSGSADRLPTNVTVTLADVAGASLNLNHLNQTIQSLNGGGAAGGAVSMGAGTLTVWGGGGFSGVLSGTGQLIKTNYLTGGTLTLSNANTYNGGTVVGGYTDNTTLAVANATGSGTGSGYVRVLTNGTFVIGAGGPAGSTAAAVITNAGTVRVSRSDQVLFSTLIVGPGAFQVQGSGTVVIDSANDYTGGTSVNPGTLRISHPGALGSGLITVANSAPGVLQLSNNITLTNPMVIASKPNAAGQIPNIENLSGTNTLAGPLSLTANGAIGWGFYATAGHLRVTGTNLTLTPSQTSQNTTRILNLRGDATGEWSGSINDTVNSGTNLSLIKAGLGTWTLSGHNNYTGPTIINDGTLVVNGSLGTGAVTVNNGVLGGRGVIKGAVTIMPGTATLSPGDSIGALTISNDLSLFGTTIMEVSHAAADQVAGVWNLNLGGTLQVLANGPLKGGEVFKLFAATNYTGDFVYDLPPLPGSLGWDYTSVPVDGTLKVTGTGPPIPPVISGFAPSSGSVGTPVIITGSFFTGATIVRFNTTSSLDYTVDSDTQITVKVPAGATSGAISVTTPDGTTTSAASFTVVSIPPPTIPPVAVSGTNLVVAVSTVVGGQYVLQSATNITPTIYWRNEATNAGTGANVIFNVPIETGKPHQFLRVWVY